MFRSSASTIRRSLVATASNRTNFAAKSSFGSYNQISKVALQQCAVRWSSTDTKEGSTDKVDTKESSAKTEPEVDDLGDVIPPEISSAEKILSLEKEIRDLKDRVVRSFAEEENVRRIAKRDVENARAYAVSGFAKALLEVGDDFERAIQAVPKDGGKITDPEAVLKTLVEGIIMTEKSLQKSFSQHGVIKYGAVGDVFDPALHDALFALPDPTKTSGTIAQVLKNGYKLKDRVLRPAQVGTIA